MVSNYELVLKWKYDEINRTIYQCVFSSMFFHCKNAARVIQYMNAILTYILPTISNPCRSPDSQYFVDDYVHVRSFMVFMLFIDCREFYSF